MSQYTPIDDIKKDLEHVELERINNSLRVQGYHRDGIVEQIEKMNFPFTCYDDISDYNRLQDRLERIDNAIEITLKELANL